MKCREANPRGAYFLIHGREVPLFAYFWLTSLRHFFRLLRNVKRYGRYLGARNWTFSSPVRIVYALLISRGITFRDVIFDRA
jgi:hypothetical protein